MGDRANCIVHQNSFNETGPVWLYTHWGGHDLLDMVQKAIQRKQRWDDSAYLTRIIFDTMSVGQQGEETGFGISTGQCDNEHHYIIVDPDKQEVHIITNADHLEDDENKNDVTHRWSFEDFCQADISAINY